MTGERKTWVVRILKLRAWMGLMGREQSWREPRPSLEEPQPRGRRKAGEGWIMEAEGRECFREGAARVGCASKSGNAMGLQNDLMTCKCTSLDWTPTLSSSFSFWLLLSGLLYCITLLFPGSKSWCGPSVILQLLCF